ncbi:MAG: hypothetical protein WC793_00575 [Candidatus Paceibacterota bacterium]|jgi:hypothetical protein
MSIERSFPPKKPNHKKPDPDSEFAPDRNFDKKQKNEMLEARKELAEEMHRRIKDERLSRAQNILVSNRQLDILKINGELDISGVKFYDRVPKPREKVIIAGEDKHIEAIFDEIVSDSNKPNQSGTVTIHVRLIK